jgi:hypothetical protein
MKVENVKLRSCFLQYNERKFEIALDNVTFVSFFWINLININKALMNGFMIGNEGLLIKLTKGETKLVLDQR